MVDKDSEEAEVIRKYVKNTHATTHNAYDLKVLEVRLSAPCRRLLLLPAWAWVEKNQGTFHSLSWKPAASGLGWVYSVLKGVS